VPALEHTVALQDDVGGDGAAAADAAAVQGDPFVRQIRGGAEEELGAGVDDGSVGV
jgi:hypothetical protein